MSLVAKYGFGVQTQALVTCEELLNTEMCGVSQCLGPCAMERSGSKVFYLSCSQFIERLSEVSFASPHP